VSQAVKSVTTLFTTLQFTHAISSNTEKRPKKAKLIVDFFRAGYRLGNFCAQHVPVFPPKPVNECTERSERNSQFLRKRFVAKRVGIL